MGLTDQFPRLQTKATAKSEWCLYWNSQGKQRFRQRVTALRLVRTPLLSQNVAWDPCSVPSSPPALPGMEATVGAHVEREVGLACASEPTQKMCHEKGIHRIATRRQRLPGNTDRWPGKRIAQTARVTYKQ